MNPNFNFQSRPPSHPYHPIMNNSEYYNYVGSASAAAAPVVPSSDPGIHRPPENPRDQLHPEFCDLHPMSPPFSGTPSWSQNQMSMNSGNYLSNPEYHNQHHYPQQYSYQHQQQIPNNNFPVYPNPPINFQPPISEIHHHHPIPFHQSIPPVVHPILPKPDIKPPIHNYQLPITIPIVGRNPPRNRNEIHSAISPIKNILSEVVAPSLGSSPSPKLSKSIPVNNEDTTRKVRIFIGKVTSLQSDLGVIDENTFFHTSVVVKGTEIPKIGDNVLVKAEAVKIQNFKWNAKEVQLVKIGLDAETALDGQAKLPQIPPPPPRISKPKSESSYSRSDRTNSSKRKSDHDRDRRRDRSRSRDRDSSRKSKSNIKSSEYSRKRDYEESHTSSKKRKSYKRRYSSDSSASSHSNVEHSRKSISSDKDKDSTLIVQNKSESIQFQSESSRISLDRTETQIEKETHKSNDNQNSESVTDILINDKSESENLTREINSTNQSELLDKASDNSPEILSSTEDVDDLTRTQNSTQSKQNLSADRVSTFENIYDGIIETVSDTDSDSANSPARGDAWKNVASEHTIRIPSVVIGKSVYGEFSEAVAYFNNILGISPESSPERVTQSELVSGSPNLGGHVENPPKNSAEPKTATDPASNSSTPLINIDQNLENQSNKHSVSISDDDDVTIIESIGIAEVKEEPPEEVSTENEDSPVNDSFLIVSDTNPVSADDSVPPPTPLPLVMCEEKLIDSDKHVESVPASADDPVPHPPPLPLSVEKLIDTDKDVESVNSILNNPTIPIEITKIKEEPSEEILTKNEDSLANDSFLSNKSCFSTSSSLSGENGTCLEDIKIKVEKSDDNLLQLTTEYAEDSEMSDFLRNCLETSDSESDDPISPPPSSVPLDDNVLDSSAGAENVGDEAQITLPVEDNVSGTTAGVENILDEVLARTDHNVSQCSASTEIIESEEHLTTNQSNFLNETVDPNLSEPQVQDNSETAQVTIMSSEHVPWDDLEIPTNNYKSPNHSHSESAESAAAEKDETKIRSRSSSTDRHRRLASELSLAEIEERKEKFRLHKEFLARKKAYLDAESAKLKKQMESNCLKGKPDKRNYRSRQGVERNRARNEQFQGLSSRRPGPSFRNPNPGNESWLGYNDSMAQEPPLFNHPSDPWTPSQQYIPPLMEQSPPFRLGVCKVCGKRGHHESVCYHRNKTSECGGQGQGTSTGTNIHKSLREGPKCQACGKIGHEANVCRHRPSDYDFSEDSYAGGGKTPGNTWDHDTSACSSRPRNKEKCTFCNKFGHHEGVCRLRRKQRK